MEIDYYDEDLPEVTLTWAESFQENKDTIKAVGLLVGIPTALFVAITFANRWMDKNWSAL